MAGVRYSLRRLEFFRIARITRRFRTVPPILSNAAPTPAITDSDVVYAKLVSFDKYAKRVDAGSTVIQHISWYFELLKRTRW